MKRKTTKIILLIIFGSIVIVFLAALDKHLKVKRLVDAFKSRAEISEEITITFTNGAVEKRMYHPIARDQLYEVEDQRSVFYTNKKEPFLGQKGDIFVTQDSPFPYVFGVHQAITFFVGGHAALNDGENTFIEAVGFPKNDEKIFDIIKDPSDGTHDFSVGVKKSSTNYWMLPDYRNESDQSFASYGTYYRDKFAVLRVKDITETILNDTISYAQTHLENRSLYNFMFITDTSNKFYCTDLISRSYRFGFYPNDIEPKYPNTLNDNGFVTTVNDLILSSDTYIAVYVENKDEIRHIYYLDDVDLTSVV